MCIYFRCRSCCVVKLTYAMDYLLQVLGMFALFSMSHANGDEKWCTGYHPDYCKYQMFTTECPKYCASGANSKDGAWGGWSNWGGCSKDCAGTQSHYRQCDNPAPVKMGKKCALTSNKGVALQETITRSCNTKSSSCSVPVNGKWEKWSHWSDCDKTCGNGHRSRKRLCVNPSPSNGGLECKKENGLTGLHEDAYRVCSLQNCPVHGGYTAWSEFTECSKPCGNGVRYKKRCCSDPVPMYGGSECHGESIQSFACNIQVCPVDGGWSAWEKWLPCNQKCGFTGEQHRLRRCDKPAKAGTGKNCVGSTDERAVCNRKNCPIDGKWDDWTGWSVCSHDCQGVQYRTRCCKKPAPKYNGLPCMGDTAELRPCRKAASSCPTVPDMQKELIDNIGSAFSSSLVTTLDMIGEEYLLKFEVKVTKKGKMLTLSTTNGHVGPNIESKDAATQGITIHAETYEVTTSNAFQKESTPFATARIDPAIYAKWIKIEVKQLLQGGEYVRTITVSQEDGTVIKTEPKTIATPYISRNVEVYAGSPGPFATGTIKDLIFSNKPSKVCPIAADIGYILDSSASAKTKFDEEKAFVQQLARAFPLPASQGSVILFASAAKHQIKLNQNNDQAKFLAALKGLVPLTDATDTRIDMGLHLAQEEMFESTNGGRSKNKLAILMTDGEQTSVPKHSGDPAKIATQMRDKNIKVFVVGVGNGVSAKTLSGIASGPYNFIHAVNWEELKNEEFISKALDLVCRLLTSDTMVVKWDRDI